MEADGPMRTPLANLPVLMRGRGMAPPLPASLPTLGAVLRYVRANAFSVNVEIKPTPGREWQTGAAVALDVLHFWQAERPLPLLSSFSETALLAAREATPLLPRAHLFDRLRGTGWSGWRVPAASHWTSIIVSCRPRWLLRRMRLGSGCFATP